MRVLHTASHEKGQIYMPMVNWLLAAGTLGAVITFGSSDALGCCQALISVSSLGFVVARLSGLWLALASLALFETIAVAVQFEDVDVVGQSVEQRTGQPLRADDLMMPPSSKGLCVVLVFSTQRSACSTG